MESSTNNSCSFGNISNYHSYGRRRLEHDEVQLISKRPNYDSDGLNSTETDNLNSEPRQLVDDAESTPTDVNLTPEEADLMPVINNQDNIRTCWGLYLKDESLHKYSLERLGIIQCGNKLKCPSYYPTELYSLLIYKPTALVNPILNHINIFSPIFDQTSDKESMARLLHNINYNDLKIPEVYLVANVITVFVNRSFLGISVTEKESDYSHYVIWLLMDILAKSINMRFHTGEYKLLGIEKELMRRRIINQSYKADGCISVAFGDTRIELLLLEVSGPFKLVDKSGFTKNHIKTGYGLIAMLNQTAYTYKFASFDVFTTIRIFFLHAKNNKLRFWSFEMPSLGIYVLHLLNSVITSDDCSTSKLPLESLFALNFGI